LLALGAGLVASPAFAADVGPFLGFSAGWSLPFDVSLHARDATALSGHIATHGGSEIAGELGYALRNGYAA
jgi:hypothetical protein